MGTFPALGSDQDFGDFQGIATMSIFQDDCHNYKIIGIDCEAVEFSEFYFNIEFNKVEFERDATQDKNVNGKIIYSRVVTSKKFSFDYLATEQNDWYFEDLVATARLIHLEKIGGDTRIIQVISIEPVIGTEVPVVQKRVYFYADSDPAIVGGTCCGSVFGDDELEIREEPQSPCEGISISADVAGDTITLNVTGAVTITSQWTLDGEDVGTNISSLEMEGYGEYQIGVLADGCFQILTYERVNACAGFGITKEVLGNVINITVDDEHMDALFTWEYSEDGVLWDLLAETSSSHVAEDDGYYRVTATDGDCTQTIIIPIGVAGCIIDGELTKDGNVLTFESELEDLTYQWYVRLDGILIPVIIDGATSSSYTALENGLYIVEVTLDGCTESFDIVHSVCTSCGAFGATLSEEAGLMTATVEGCAEPEYKWFIDEGGSKDLLPGGLNTYTPEVDGIYFLVICCGTCTPVIFTITKIGGTILFTNNTLIGDASWSM